MNIWLTLLTTSLVILGVVSTRPTHAQDNNDFLVMRVGVDPVMQPRSLQDTLTDGVRNPVLGPIAVVAAVYLGVPPGAIAGVAAAAAVPRHEEEKEENFYSFLVPVGYTFCAARFSLVSIVPADGTRASHLAANAQADQLNIYTWTPRRRAGEGRSWVEVNADVIAIRREARTKYSSKCLQNDDTSPLLDCRGRNCPGAQGVDWLH